MHRISHWYNVARKLFDHGYLSIGFSDAQELFEPALSGDEEKYNDACNKVYVGQSWWTGVKRKQPWRFLTMSVGDIVVIPLPYGEFSICKVTGKPMKISDFDLSVLGADKGQLVIKEDCLFDGETFVDLGFLLPIKPIKPPLSRNEYADANLTSGMKFQQTNYYMNKISESIEKAINAETPINFYDNAIKIISNQFLNAMQTDLNENKFEKLVAWFMKKQGFESYIPPKKERGKEDFADADIISRNEFLKLIIHIQAKYHKDTSDSWGVEQISRYTKQKGVEEDYTYIKWLISTADNFSDDAKTLALEKEVRLIDGITFAQMLIDAGVGSINDAFH